jgi:hypothetical protein
MQQFGSQDWRAGRIREWLLLLLRFAITRDPKDELAVFAIANSFCSPPSPGRVQGHRTFGARATVRGRGADAVPPRRGPN